MQSRIGLKISTRVEVSKFKALTLRNKYYTYTLSKISGYPNMPEISILQIKMKEYLKQIHVKGGCLYQKQFYHHLPVKDSLVQEAKI